MGTVKKRQADQSDLAAIVSLAQANRQQLARWSPVYFNPREGSDEAHSGFLGFVVSSDDQEAVVIEDDNGVLAFFVRIHQAEHLWLDDLCVKDTDRWSEVVAALELPGRGWVTCASVKDRERIAAMAEVGARCLSRYWVRSTSDVAGQKARTHGGVDADAGLAAPHTFGGQAFTPGLEGALVVTDGQGGYVIGSPSASPPIYDPGGPTCVIDQVVGEDRAALVDVALAVCAGRGDAQVVVVCRDEDTALAATLEGRGFTAEVLLIGK